jgi:23S rRNA pseudouridine1911/1915/1917 synthase
VGDTSWRVGPAEAGGRLDRFLADASRLGSRGRARAALDRGKVFVNGVESASTAAGQPLAAGDLVRVWSDRPGSSRRRVTHHTPEGPLRIVYEDDELIVVDKPAGLLAVPLDRRSGSVSVQDLLVEHLRSRGKRRPLVVHRIDRDTSGLVAFTTRGEAQARLRDQFRKRLPERVYLALVYGRPSPPSGTWRDRLVWDDAALIQKETHPRDPRGKDAVSEYRVVEAFAHAALLEVRLVTGRRNQIRLQARLRGHVLVGEQRYTYGPAELRPIDFPRQALHAHRLSLEHPSSGRRLTFESPLPPDMVELVNRLRRKA